MSVDTSQVNAVQQLLQFFTALLLGIVGVVFRQVLTRIEAGEQRLERLESKHTDTALKVARMEGRTQHAAQ